MEIDAEKNQKLLKDKIVNKIAKKLAGRKNVGHGYELSNLYRIMRVFKWTNLFFLGGKQNKKWKLLKRKQL